MLRPRKKKEEKIKLTKESYTQAKKIFAYIKPYGGLFAIGWVFLVFSSLIGLAFPLLMGQLLGADSSKNSSMQGLLELISADSISTFAIALFAMFAIQAFFSFFRIIIFNKVTEDTLRDIRKDAFGRLIYMPMDFYNRNTVGELTSRIANDIEKIQETLRTTIAEFFRQIVIIFGGILFLFVISPKLALIMLATLPVMVIIAVVFGRFIKRLSKEAQDEAAKSNVVIEESLMGISNVKSFTNEGFMLGKYITSINAIRNLNIKSGLWRGVFVSFLILCMSGAIVFIIWQGLLMTEGPNPAFSRGDFFSFIMFTIMIGTSFGGLPDMYSTIQKAIGSTENLMKIISENTELQLHTGIQKPAISGAVRFENVNFSYPQRADVPVLQGISFHANKDETIAFVGASGAGKSTIASMLLDYYNPDSGLISFDGVPNSEIDLEYLRSNIAIVPQEVILFGGTIKDNISFGRPGASEEEIITAAEKANAWEFISTFPEGLETQVGDRGIQLSGGQKQRIAIARAILKNPTILILDEATSALDSESERLVQDALNNLMKGRTSFVIAHRLSTIRNADKIMVIQDGKIVEEGKHDDLIAENGAYKSYIDLQRG